MRRLSRWNEQDIWIMKKLPSALLSGVFAFSTVAASAGLAAIAVDPQEIVVTAKQVILGKNTFNYTVLDNAPEKSVTIISTQAVKDEKKIVPCEDVTQLAAAFNQLSPAERLEEALRFIDESHAERPVRLVISDADGPIEPMEARNRARLVAAGFANANLDRAIQKAVRICAPSLK
jgi:hypothetical protein